MRHDFHYVEELNVANRPVGKIIPIDSIEPNPEQPRTEIGDLTDLSSSIKEKGVLEPLLVKPIANGRYMIIAGERRWRASHLAGLQEVPCIELDIDENGVAEIALIENLQRKDLTIWEEADGLKALAEKFGYTQDQIAKKISKSRTTVTEIMTIAGIPKQIREKCHSGNISSKSTLLEIARQFDDEAMLKFVNTLGSETLDRESLRKTARADRTESSAASKDRMPKERNGFRYAPADSRCLVEVKFNDPDMLNRSNVLKALKSAFDAVKNEDIEIGTAISTDK
jgi:ParB family chromosome partitioning protein